MAGRGTAVAALYGRTVRHNCPNVADSPTVAPPNDGAWPPRHEKARTSAVVVILAFDSHKGNTRLSAASLVPPAGFSPTSQRLKGAVLSIWLTEAEDGRPTRLCSLHFSV